MASTKQLSLSTRNLIWLIAVIASAIVAFVVGGWKMAALAAVVVLALSEIIERRARSARTAASPTT